MKLNGSIRRAFILQHFYFWKSPKYISTQKHMDDLCCPGGFQLGGCARTVWSLDETLAVLICSAASGRSALFRVIPDQQFLHLAQELGGYFRVLALFEDLADHRFAFFSELFLFLPKYPFICSKGKHQKNPRPNINGEVGFPPSPPKKNRFLDLFGPFWALFDPLLHSNKGALRRTKIHSDNILTTLGLHSDYFWLNSDYILTTFWLFLTKETKKD